MLTLQNSMMINQTNLHRARLAVGRGEAFLPNRAVRLAAVQHYSPEGEDVSVREVRSLESGAAASV